MRILVPSLMLACSALIAGCGTNPLAYPQNRAGVTYLREDQYRQAIDKFDYALQKEANYAYGMNNRGLAYIRTEDYHKALDDFEQTTAVHKRYKHAYNNFGVLYEIANDDDAAEQSFNKAIQIRDDYEEPYFNLARLYYARGDHGMALEYVEYALELEGNKRGGWDAAEYLYSLLLEQMGERPVEQQAYGSEEDHGRNAHDVTVIENASTKPVFPHYRRGVLGN